MSEFQTIGQAAAGVVRKLSSDEYRTRVLPWLTIVSLKAAAAAREASDAKLYADNVAGMMPAFETFAEADLDTAERALTKALEAVRQTRAVMRGEV